MTSDTPDAFQLMVLLRRFNMESDRFIERFAALHRLHRTDLNALVVILDAFNEGRALSPGELGAALALSPPATTALVDRLEGAGHVERRRSATDRRKVEVVMNEQAVRLAGQFFAPLGAHLSAAISTLSEAERRVVGDFLARTTAATQAATRETDALTSP